jgi:hypothetical protein
VTGVERDAAAIAKARELAGGRTFAKQTPHPVSVETAALKVETGGLG